MKKTKQHKSQERMDEDDQVWGDYIDWSRMEPYKKKGYRFSQSIVTDGVSVSIPLRKIGATKKKRKHSKTTTEEEEEYIDWNSLVGRPVVGVDPGKHSILYMTSNEVIQKRGKKQIQISNIQKRRAIGAKATHYQQMKRKKRKKYKSIQELETKLSAVSSKSPTLKGFQHYLKVRFTVQEELYTYYSSKMYRIHRWKKYKSEQRFNQYLVNRIRAIFDHDCVLAYGSWNRTSQMKGLIPSSGIGMKRLLSKHFTVVTTPEYNTTKTCSKCMIGEMKPVKSRPHPNPKKLKEDPNCKLDVRGLRRCNNESCQVFINRDYNAAINIRRNLLHRIQHGSWHPSFTSNIKEEKLYSKKDQAQLHCAHSQVGGPVMSTADGWAKKQGE